MTSSQSQPGRAASPATSDTQPSAAWTPGPWRIHHYEWISGRTDPDDEGDIICEQPGPAFLASRAHWPANARLIAAAPDMHEALKEAAEWLDWYFAAEPAVRVGPSSIELRRIVRAALSKAETK